MMVGSSIPQGEHHASKIAILVGSLRKNSLTKKVANAFAMLSSEHLACSFIEIGDLPTS
jgi:chromate reductase